MHTMLHTGMSSTAGWDGSGPPSKEQLSPPGEFLEWSPALRPGFKPMRIICERELDADHVCDARATSRPCLYPGILANMDVSELAQVPMLAMLPQHRLEYLAENSAAPRFTAGHIVAHRGDPALHLIIVHEGTVSATHDTRDGA
jgi:hypothetical protein